MRRSVLRTFTIITATAALLVSAAIAWAAPKTPTGMGVMEPRGLADVGCPWPDVANGFLESIGVEKCLPTHIAWSDDGVRIVTDPLVALGESEASGWVTFWCQSRVGFTYRIGVTGLEPHAAYEVTATDGIDTWMLHTVHTDAAGNGIVGGTLSLAPGGYELVITVGTVLETPADDLPGFGVY